jgi:hypothetical protein
MLELIVEFDGERNKHIGEQGEQGQTHSHNAILYCRRTAQASPSGCLPAWM